MSALVMCPACSTVAEDGAAFCEECGTRLPAPAATTERNGMDDDVQSPAPQVRHPVEAEMPQVETPGAELPVAEVPVGVEPGLEVETPVKAAETAESGAGEGAAGEPAEAEAEIAGTTEPVEPVGLPEASAETAESEHAGTPVVPATDDDAEVAVPELPEAQATGPAVEGAEPAVAESESPEVEGGTPELVAGEPLTPEPVAAEPPAAEAEPLEPEAPAPETSTLEAPEPAPPATEELPSDDFGTPDSFGTPPAYGRATGPMTVAHVPAQPYPTARSAAMAPAIRVCTYCQGTIAQDGYCLECGEREVSPRDRFGERPARWIAGVSDLGLVHKRNEDALSLAVATGGGAAVTGTGVLVVCDGVTTAPDSDVASLAAAQAASGTMVRTITAGDPRAPRQGLLSAAIRAAHTAAAQAVIDTTSPDLSEEDAPSCTFVACAVEPGTIVAGWVGDSRAYWFPDGGTPVQISSDHSWAAELVAEGMSEEEAMATPNAHAITRWVGRDAPGEGPDLVALHPSVGGLVLLCSDGLWNYCPEPKELAALVEETRTRTGSGLEAIAVALVDWARAQGGRDNISVALARLDSLEPAARTAPAASSSTSVEPATTTVGDETDRSTSESSTTERGTDGDVQR